MLDPSGPSDGLRWVGGGSGLVDDEEVGPLAAFDTHLEGLVGGEGVVDVHREQVRGPVLLDPGDLVFLALDQRLAGCAAGVRVDVQARLHLRGVGAQIARIDHAVAVGVPGRGVGGPVTGGLGGSGLAASQLRDRGRVRRSRRSGSTTFELLDPIFEVVESRITVDIHDGATLVPIVFRIHLFQHHSISLPRSVHVIGEVLDAPIDEPRIRAVEGILVTGVGGGVGDLVDGVRLPEDRCVVHDRRNHESVHETPDDEADEDGLPTYVVEEVLLCHGAISRAW